MFYRKYGMYKEWAKQVAHDGALRTPESRPGRDVGAESAIWDSVPTLKGESSDVSGLQEADKPRTTSSGAANGGLGKSPIPPSQRLSIPIKSPLTGVDSKPPEPVLARPPARKPSLVSSGKATPPAPGDLLTPAPIPGSTRAQRDAYLASATYLPLEMLSEVETPRPPSDDSSQPSSSRLAFLLSLRVKSPNISVTGKSAATTIKGGKTVRSASDPVKSTVTAGVKQNGKRTTSSRIASIARGRVPQSALSPRLVALPLASDATLSSDVLKALPALDADTAMTISSSILASPRPDQAINLKSNQSGLLSNSALGLTVGPTTARQDVRAEAGTEIGDRDSQRSRTPLDVAQKDAQKFSMEAPTAEARHIPRRLGSETSFRVLQDPVNTPVPLSTAVEHAVKSSAASTSQQPSHRQSPGLEGHRSRWTISVRPSAVPELTPLPTNFGDDEQSQNAQAQGPNAQSKIRSVSSPGYEQTHLSPQKLGPQIVQQDHSSTHRQQLPILRPALSKSLSGLSGNGRTLGRRHRDPSSANLTAHFEPATYPLPPSGSGSETVVVSPPVTDKSLTVSALTKATAVFADVQVGAPPTPVSLNQLAVFGEGGKPDGHLAGGLDALSQSLGPQGAFARKVATSAGSDSRHLQVPTLSSTPHNGGAPSHLQGTSQPYLDPAPQSSETLTSPRSDPPAHDIPQRQPMIDRSAPQHPTIVIPAPLGEDYADHLSFEVPSGSRGRLRVSLAWFRDGARTERRGRSRAEQVRTEPDLPPPVPPKSPRRISSRLRDEHPSFDEHMARHESDLRPALSSHGISHQPQVTDRTRGPYRPPPLLDERRADGRDELRSRLSPPSVDVPRQTWAGSPILPYAPHHPFHSPVPGVHSLAYPQPPNRPHVFGPWPMASPIGPAIVPTPFASAQAPLSRAPPSPPRPPSIDPPSSRGSPTRPLSGLPFMPAPPGRGYPPADLNLGLQNPWGLGPQPAGRQQRGGLWSQFFGGRKTYGEGLDPGEDAEIQRWRTDIPTQQVPPPARTYAPTLARTIFTSRDKRTRQPDSRWDAIMPSRTRGGWYDRPPRTPPASLPPLPLVAPRLPNTTRNPFRSRRVDVSFDRLATERQREKEERRRAKADRRDRREAQSRDTSGDIPRDSRRRGGLGGFVPWTALGAVTNSGADGRKRGFNLRGKGGERLPDKGRQYAPKPDPMARGRSGDMLRGWVDSVRPFVRKQGQEGQVNRSKQGAPRRDTRMTPRASAGRAGKEELRGLMDGGGLGRKPSSKKWSDRARGIPRR